MRQIEPLNVCQLANYRFCWVVELIYINPHCEIKRRLPLVDFYGAATIMLFDDIAGAFWRAAINITYAAIE